MTHKWLWMTALSVLCAMPLNVAAQPVITDSRIKTLVYNANDVYRLVTHHGYQSHIEFGPKERIHTISLGDKISWQVIPDGRRLFLRSLVSGAHTNLTVITNKYSYQFDIEATGGGKLPVREDLVYVARFYYPDEYLPKTAAYSLPPVYADEVLANVPDPSAPPPEQPKEASLPPLNFSYTFTGDPMLAPSRIFDDGSATYFELSQPGSIFAVDPQGQEMPVPSVPTSDGFQKVAMIQPRFVVRYNDGYVCIYNEALAGGQ